MPKPSPRLRPPFSSCGERPIDPGIRKEVEILWNNGIETSESCEGGEGHPFPEPTVRFRGDNAEGFKALGIALQNGLRVSELRRFWSIQDGEPHGPEWEMTFINKEPGTGGKPLCKDCAKLNADGK
jgi:hypothetical protein